MAEKKRTFPHVLLLLLFIAAGIFLMPTGVRAAKKETYMGTTVAINPYSEAFFYVEGGCRFCYDDPGTDRYGASIHDNKSGPIRITIGGIADQKPGASLIFKGKNIYYTMTKRGSDTTDLYYMDYYTDKSTLAGHYPSANGEMLGIYGNYLLLGKTNGEYVSGSTWGRDFNLYLYNRKTGKNVNLKRTANPEGYQYDRYYFWIEKNTLYSLDIPTGKCYTIGKCGYDGYKIANGKLYYGTVKEADGGKNFTLTVTRCTYKGKSKKVMMKTKLDRSKYGYIYYLGNNVCFAPNSILLADYDTFYQMSYSTKKMTPITQDQFYSLLKKANFRLIPAHGFGG